MEYQVVYDLETMSRPTDYLLLIFAGMGLVIALFNLWAIFKLKAPIVIAGIAILIGGIFIARAYKLHETFDEELYEHYKAGTFEILQGEINTYRPGCWANSRRPGCQELFYVGDDYVQFSQHGTPGYAIIGPYGGVFEEGLNVIIWVVRDSEFDQDAIIHIEIAKE